MAIGPAGAEGSSSPPQPEKQINAVTMDTKEDIHMRVLFMISPCCWQTGAKIGT
jgi:hypothetical protein